MLKTNTLWNPNERCISLYSTEERMSQQCQLNLCSQHWLKKKKNTRLSTND